MTPEQQQLLAKSKDSLKAARLLLENNLPAFATARAYYTMFYIAEAMLLKKRVGLFKSRCCYCCIW